MYTNQNMANLVLLRNRNLHALTIALVTILIQQKADIIVNKTAYSICKLDVSLIYT